MSNLEKKNLLLLASSNFLFFFSLGLFFFFPNYLGSLKATKSYIGFMMGVPAIIQIILGLKLRNKIDLMNKKNILMASSVFSALLFLAYIFLKSLYILPGIRILQGIVNGIGVIFGLSLAVDLVPAEKRAGTLGLYGISSALPSLIAPFLAETLMRYLSFNYIFAIAMAVAVLRTFAISMIKIPPKDASYTPPKGVRIKEYSKIIPLAILAGAVYGTLFNFISHYAAILKITYISIFAQTHITVMLLMRLSFHNKLDTWRRDKVIIVSYIFAFLCLFSSFILKYVPFIPMLMAIGAFYGVVQGLLFPSLNALFIETTPLRSGKATIIFVVSRNIGIAVFAFICGFIAQKVGYHYMYLIVSIIVAALVVYIIIKRKEILGIKTL